MSQPQVVILGCGFAGPVLALCLKKRGVSSVIYEFRAPSYTQGGNIALAPNALRVLDHVGIFDRIRNQGYNYSEISFDNSEGVSLGKFLNGSKTHYNYEAVRISRTIVRDELRKQLQKEGVEVKWEKKMTTISETADSKVELIFEDGERVIADFLIGADGMHSKVRPYFAPEAKPEFSGLMGVMGYAERSDVTAEALNGMSLPCFLFGASGSFAIMPSSFDGHRLGYFATLEVEDRDREGWAKLENSKDELYEMLHSRFIDNKQGHWNELVPQLVDKTPKQTLSSWPFYSVPHLETWFSESGRVIVIGDAAHAIPPTGGQGAAMALEDAETLAYAFARIYADDFQQDNLTNTLQQWQKHRVDRVAKVIDFTSKNGKLRKSSPHRYEQAAKEWLIWAMFKWMGEEGGARWMYSYNAESVQAVLP